MSTKSATIVALSEMVHGQEADLFVLMTAKEELKTREGKPYFKVGFRDAAREVTFPIWGDSPWAEECRRQWTPGAYYKLRAVYRDTTYGPQLDIRKIRETAATDAADGFDAGLFVPQSRFPAEAMFGELCTTARENINDVALSALVLSILETNRERLLSLPAATRNHHAYLAGYLEHVLSVTKTCVYLAEKYAEYYPDMQPPLNRGLVVAGGILHDIGKLREIQWQPEGAAYTAEGRLIGHILQGRDIVREAAAAHPIDADLLLRLEHIIISHQRLPEWGSPKPPMTPEALLVHYADDVDAKYNMIYTTLRDDETPGPLTSKKNQLYQHLYRGKQ
ncbi:MAG: HD domain-containing protein [Planctomycetia bacterium]|nr:HD domain-containing protein [Planctomycetia bacterium]